MVYSIVTISLWWPHCSSLERRTEREWEKCLSANPWLHSCWQCWWGKEHCRTTIWTLIQERKIIQKEKRWGMGYISKVHTEKFHSSLHLSQNTRQQIYEKRIIINDLVLQAWAIIYKPHLLSMLLKSCVQLE